MREIRDIFRRVFLASCLALCACSAATARETSGPPLTPASAGAEASAAPQGTPAPTERDGAVGTRMPEFPSTAPESWLNGEPVRVSSPGVDLLLVESWHRL